MNNFTVSKQFNSLAEMVNHCQEKGGTLYGYIQDQSFTLTRNMEAADKLCESGWPEGAEKLQRGVHAAINCSASTTVTDTVYDVVGPIPDMGAFCSGDPECMINPSEPMEIPVVRVIVDSNMIADVTHTQSINRGAAILAACKRIEDSGQRVEIIATCTALVNGGVGTYGVVVKKATDHFNLHSLAYCLIHPSYYRRHGFRIWGKEGACSSSSRRSDSNGALEYYGQYDLYFPCINEVSNYHHHFATIESAVHYVNEIVDKMNA